MKILEPRTYYKPFDYPFAYELWRKHESMHWLGFEVPLADDVRDWNTKLSAGEKELLTHLFRFFTQADVDVAAGYNKIFTPYFGHKPELAMMMSSFAAREAVHIDAYSLLLETVGMPEASYAAFQEYAAMKEKHDYFANFNATNPYEVAKSLAVYSAFGEGMQLFSSFVILLNFARHNKMKGMGNIIAWSVRDEDLHVEGMTTVFKEFWKELPEGKDVWLAVAMSQKEKPLTYLQIREAARKMVDLEDQFIDLCFGDRFTIEGLTPDEVKKYIRFIANKRWTQLGFDGQLFKDVDKNPLPWVDYMVNGEEHTNFFESKSTFYSKAMTQGTMDDIQW